MGKVPSEHYWNVHKHKYPFQIEVPHMSEHDIDPRKAQQLVSFYFLRVPFDGKSHWGFMYEHELNKFKQLVGLK